MFTIGCHLSSAKGFLRMAKDAKSIKANTFQFFTRNPRGGKAKTLDQKDLAAFHVFAQECGIARILAHAPYTLNPASDNPKTLEFAALVLEQDLERMEQTPDQLYNMHPGCAVGQPKDVALEKVATALNKALKPSQTTMLLLETMAGKGTELGSTFEELATIVEKVELHERVGVCLDTCHVWDAGYDIATDLDGVIEKFDQVIGLDRLRAIHLNDSLNSCGARKDRHARLGEGHIGIAAFESIVNHPKLRDLPFYLETPNPTLGGYAQEIALLQEYRHSCRG